MSHHELPKKEDIQAIACDLDGTLLTNYFSIHPKNKEVIARIRNDYPQLPIIIATGRDYYSSKFVRKELDLDCFPSVNLQGALVYTGDGELRIDASFFPEHVLRVLDRFVEEDRAVILDAGNNVLFAHTGIDIEYWSKKLKNYGYYITEKNFVTHDRQELISGNIKVKRIFLPYSEDQHASTLSILNSLWDGSFSITSNVSKILEVVPAGFNKANAIRSLCGPLGISMEKTIAFGDAPNDIEMLSEVGYGVAMSNAFSLVKGVAKYVAPSNDEGGVGLFLEKIFYDNN